MRVTEITVSAGRTFSHPYESYSNLRPHVTLKAEIAEGENFQDCVKDLQAQAEGLIEEHKRTILTSLHELWKLKNLDERAAALKEQITHAQHELDALREEQGKMPDLMLPTTRPSADE